MVFTWKIYFTHLPKNAQIFHNIWPKNNFLPEMRIACDIMQWASSVMTTGVGDESTLGGQDI